MRYDLLQWYTSYLGHAVVPCSMMDVMARLRAGRGAGLRGTRGGPRKSVAPLPFSVEVSVRDLSASSPVLCRLARVNVETRARNVLASLLAFDGGKQGFVHVQLTLGIPAG